MKKIKFKRNKIKEEVEIKCVFFLVILFVFFFFINVNPWKKILNKKKKRNKKSLKFSIIYKILTYFIVFYHLI